MTFGFIEDVPNEILKKEFDLFSESEPTSVPVLFSKSYKDELASSQISYTDGDVIPLHYFNSNLKFIYRELPISTLSSSEIDLYLERYHVLISSKPFIKLQEEVIISSGIFNLEDFKKGLEGISYREGLKLNLDGFTTSKTLNSYKSVTSLNENQLIKGKLPTHDNEIVSADIQFYEMLFEHSNNSVNEFVKNYRDFCPLHDDYFLLNNLVTSFKIVGLVSNPSKNDIYLTPTLFSKLQSTARQNEFYFDDYSSRSTLYAPAFIANSLSISETDRFDLSAYLDESFGDFLYYSRNQMIFLGSLAEILGVISLGTTFLFINNNSKKNYKNLALLSLIGRKKGERAFFTLSLLTFIFIIPLIVGMSCGILFTRLVKNIPLFAMTKIPLITNFSWAFPILLLVFLLLILFSYPVFIRINKKKSLEYLNHE